MSASDSEARKAFLSMRAYHTSRLAIFAKDLIRSRYERTHAIAALRWSAAENPFDLAASTKLAASRFKSHSHGPCSVSSKSLMSKMIRRSGVANPPKFIR